MGAAWTLPGYDVQELVGFGGSGEVWRAVALDSGEDVALKRLHTTDAVARERLRREAAVLSSVAGEHVVRVRDVVVSDTAAVLVMDFAPGGSLATVLAVRTRLPAPEVVTLVAPLAGALADAHDRGIVHGDVTPANIVFTADGRPLLGDFGVARAVGAAAASGVEGTAPYLAPEVLAGGSPQPASDIWSLCTIAMDAIDKETAPPALLDALERGLAADPYERTDARSLAGDVLRSCAAAPVGLVRAALLRPAAVTQPVRVAAVSEPVAPAGPRHSARRRVASRRLVSRDTMSRIARPVTITVVAVLALLLAVAGGMAWGHRTQSAATMLVAPATTSPSASSSRPDWASVVAGLDAARSRAYAQGDVRVLDEVYAPRTRALALDRAAVEAIAGRGLRAVGLTQTTLQLRPVVETPSDVTLRVTDAISAYRLVDVTGRVVSVGAARAARTFTMELTRTAAGWRIQDISAS